MKLINNLHIIIKLKTSESYIKYVINYKCEIININNYIHGTWNLKIDMFMFMGWTCHKLKSKCSNDLRILFTTMEATSQIFL